MVAPGFLEVPKGFDDDRWVAPLCQRQNGSLLLAVCATSPKLRLLKVSQTMWSALCDNFVVDVQGLPIYGDAFKQLKILWLEVSDVCDADAPPVSVAAWDKGQDILGLALKQAELLERLVLKFV